MHSKSSNQPKSSANLCRAVRLVRLISGAQAVNGCLYCITEYRLISKKGEGTFSEVLKAQSTKTNKYVAIKCMKAHFYNIDQVRFSSVR